jgi:hypothetical protein
LLIFTLNTNTKISCKKFCFYILDILTDPFPFEDERETNQNDHNESQESANNENYEDFVDVDLRSETVSFATPKSKSYESFQMKKKARNDTGSLHYV